MSTLALVCWLPVIILNILIRITKTSIPGKFYFMVNILNYSNSFVNPIVTYSEFLSFSKRCVLAVRRGDQPLSKNQKTKPKSCTHNARDRTKNITKQPQSPASWGWTRRYMDTKFWSAEIRGPPHRYLIVTSIRGRSHKCELLDNVLRFSIFCFTEPCCCMGLLFAAAVYTS